MLYIPSFVCPSTIALPTPAYRPSLAPLASGTSILPSSSESLGFRDDALVDSGEVGHP